ncbi:nuclear transport factor 2 family protein [Macrococcoides bohemicum]|nr:nuclear transport factor 2 family protein [Macrococcus bohemicus]
MNNKILNLMIGAIQMITPEEQVYLVYKSLYEAMINKDVDCIDRLMMDGSFLVHMTGYKQPKREWIKAIEDQSMKYFSSKEENIEIMMKDKKATLIAQNRVDANINGSRNTWPLELTMYMVKFEKDWKISHIDATTY